MSAVSADFGIKTSVDDAGIKTLIEHLKSIPEHAKKISDVFKTVVTDVVSSAERMSKSAVDADGKVVQSKVISSAKIRAEVTKYVDHGKSAEELLTQVAATNATKRTALAGKEFKALETDLVLMRTKRQDIEAAITQSTDKELTKRLQAQKKELAEELKLVTTEYKQRDEVVHGGQGAKNGVLGLKREMEGVAQNASASLGPLGGVISSMGPAGMVAAAGIGALGAGIKASMDVGMQFEDQLADLRAITGATAEATEGMGAKARELAKTFGTDATEQVGTFKTILSRLGPDIAKDQDALALMTKNVNILSKATGDDAEKSVDALTTAMLQFGVDLSNPAQAAGEMTRMMNVMAAGAQAGASEVPQVAEALKVVGVAAKGAKLSFEETNGALQVLSAGGKNGSEAGTALRNVLGLLQKQSGPGAEQLKKMGLSVEQLGESLTTKGVGATMQMLGEKLDHVGTAAQKNAAMMTLFGTENSAAAGILLDHAKDIDTMTAAVTNTTTAQEQADIKMKTMSERFKRVGAQLKDLAIGGYDYVKIAINGLMDAGVALGNFFSGFFSFLSENKEVFIGMGAAIGIVAIAMNATAIAAGAATVAQGIWNGVVAIGSGIMVGFNAIMAVNPFVLIGVAVVGLTMGMMYLYQHVKPVRDILDSVWAVIKAGGVAIGAFVSNYVSSLVKAFEGVGKVLTSLIHLDFSGVAEGAKQVGESIGSAYVGGAKAAMDAGGKSLTDSNLKKQWENAADSAVANLTALDKKLADPKLSEAQRASLEKQREQWAEYGKKAGAKYKYERDKAASVPIATGAPSGSGAVASASGDDKKAAKADKDAYDAAKKLEDVRYGQEKLALDRQLAAKLITHEQYNDKLEVVENTHIEKLNDIASQHRKGHEQDAISAEAAFLKMKVALNDKEVAAEKKKQEEIQKERDKALKLDEKRLKVLDDIQEEKERSAIDGIKDENAKAIALETARYNKELDDRTEDLMDMKTGKLLAESLEQNHQGKLAAIQQQARDRDTAQMRGYLDKGLELLSGTWEERASKIKDFLLQEVQQFVMSEAAKIITRNSSEAAQTALVVAGFVARQATYVAEGIASAASAAGTWIAVAAKAVYNAFESLPFPLDIVAAIAAVGGVVALATQVPKMFHAHAAGTDNAPGGLSLVGERGPELMNVPRGAQIIPNHHLPNLGAPPMDLSPLVSRLESIERATNRANDTFSRRPAPVLPMNNTFENARNNYIKSEERRSF